MDQSRNGLPAFSRYNLETVETRTTAAAELYHEGYYPSIAKAARALQVPYKRLWSRVQGRRPRAENGGNRALLNDAEEQVVLCWSHRRITQGHHIQYRALQHHCNSILRAPGREPNASRSWAKRFMQRWDHIFHVRKSSTRDAKRKAMQDRAHIESFYRGWEQCVEQYDIKLENIWNFDETGFQVGYLQKGTFVWTFIDITQPVLVSIL